MYHAAVAEAAKMFMEVHSQVEAQGAVNNRLRTELAQSDHALATIKLEQAGTTRALLQQVTSNELGHIARDMIAADLSRKHPRAAISFLQAADVCTEFLSDTVR